ncbi:MAG: NAD-dependent epimerase/dehydratase family protein [Chloroflexi bacterium]|nr:NAD-dependent epimerase/dehydratase family protein [Chloroflexota bacterium]
MRTTELNVVTGAFSYTGKYITQRLLSMGKRVRTLTGRSGYENPFGCQVEAFAFNFDNPSQLTKSLSGATTLYNTYWVRFSHGEVTFDNAVENTQTLIKAAEEAGVSRVVHISITNPSERSPLPYFRGKALLEKAITHSKLSYAIVRPTVIFGTEGILINNIAWLLRRFPIFAIFGSGDYRIQPVFVEDMAEIAVNVARKADNMVVDAVGPEIFTFHELVRLIADSIHSKARIVRVRPGVAFFLARLIGYGVKDVVITKDEIEGLMSNLLVSEGHPTAQTHFSEWLGHNANNIGIKYISGLRRSYH